MIGRDGRTIGTPLIDLFACFILFIFIYLCVYVLCMHVCMYFGGRVSLCKTKSPET